MRRCHFARILFDPPQTKTPHLPSVAWTADVISSWRLSSSACLCIKWKLIWNNTSGVLCHFQYEVGSHLQNAIPEVLYGLFMVYLWFIDIQWRQFREVFWGLVWRSIEKDLKGWWCQDSIPQSHRDSGRKKREALRIRLFRIDLSGVFWGFWAAHKYVS
jgi:hypothetical protein